MLSSASVSRYGAFRPYGPQPRTWPSQPRSSLLTCKRLPHRLPEATKETINWVSLSNGGQQESKAYWLAPNNNPQDAKAVVLFFHGFSQPPTAYVMLLKAVADAGCLVLAPSFPFRSKPKDQQDIYIEEGKEWLQMIVDRSLPSPLNTVTAAAAGRRGLLAHSVGGGLAPYFASTAAADGKPFKAVHVLAPMTQVVDPYRSKLANPGPPPEPATGPIPNWPATGSTITKWGIQYGALDTLAPPALALELLLLLLDAEQEGRKLAVPKASEDIISWPLGTHTGFQDQVMNPGNGNSIVDDVLAPLRKFVIVVFLPVALLIQWLLRRLKPQPESELDGEAAAISEPTTRLAASPRLAVRGLQGGKARLLPRSGLLQAFDGDNDLQLLQLQQELTQRLAPPPAAPQPLQPLSLRAGAAAPAPVAKRGTEEVDVPTLEESEQEYKFLLAVVVGLGLVVTAWSTTWPLPDKLSGVASTLVVALFVYLGVNGVNSLSLLDDCYKEQRPFSRAAAVKFFQDHLL